MFGHVRSQSVLGITTNPSTITSSLSDQAGRSGQDRLWALWGLRVGGRTRHKVFMSGVTPVLQAEIGAPPLIFTTGTHSGRTTTRDQQRNTSIKKKKNCLACGALALISLRT